MQYQYTTKLTLSPVQQRQFRVAGTFVKAADKYATEARKATSETERTTLNECAKALENVGLEISRMHPFDFVNQFISTPVWNS